MIRQAYIFQVNTAVGDGKLLMNRIIPQEVDVLFVQVRNGKNRAMIPPMQHTINSVKATNHRWYFLSSKTFTSTGAGSSLIVAFSGCISHGISNWGIHAG